MNDAERYRREIATILQELEADKTLRDQDIQKKREAVWKMLEKSFSELAIKQNWTAEHFERFKQGILDNFFPRGDQD